MYYSMILGKITIPNTIDEGFENIESLDENITIIFSFDFSESSFYQRNKKLLKNFIWNTP